MSSEVFIFSKRSSFLEASLLSSSMVFLLRREMCFMDDLREDMRSSRKVLLEPYGMFYIRL